MTEDRVDNEKVSLAEVEKLIDQLETDALAGAASITDTDKGRVVLSSSANYRKRQAATNLRVFLAVAKAAMDKQTLDAHATATHTMGFEPCVTCDAWSAATVALRDALAKVRE